MTTPLVGLQEDFGEIVLPDVLGRFARAHPKMRIEARVARNTELLERVDTGQLDIALVWGAAGVPDERRTVTLPERNRRAVDALDRFGERAVSRGS